MAIEVNQNCDLLDVSEIIDVLKTSTTSHESACSIDPNKLKCIATECLQAFVKYNWFCSHCQYPPLSPELIELLNDSFPDPFNYLSPNDKYIPAFSRLKYTVLLCYATSLLHHFKPEESLEDCLWTIRILIIKQMIIHESCNVTYVKLEKNIEILEKHLENLEEKKTVILGYSLAAQVYLWYGYVQIAFQFLQKAIDLSNLKIDLEGKLGKRTKYQSESKSLLSVSITRKSDTEEATGSCNLNETSMVSSIASCSSTNGSSNSVISNFLPKNVKLMDDTLLTKVKFDEEVGQSSAIVLREEEETIVCGLISYLMQSTGSDNNLVQEEVFAYLDYLIEHSTVWSVNFKCLYLRSLLERSRSRKLERGMMQLEELVNSTKNESCAGCSWKLHLFYPILTEPIWKIEKVLADTLFSMGCVKTALDFYKDLNLWEEMVNCYCRLDQRGKAELVVRQQLEIQVTPYLLNILGDVTNDKDCYIKAWELSSHKSARSQKSLGDWHFFRKEYAEAIPYYVTSLDINSIAYPAWARLAYAALTTEDYPLSAKAYRRVLEFETDNFEAWNNLSKAYIKMGDKHRAFRTLQESLKCSYEEWRIWENYMLVSIDVGAFDEVIRAWHRLIDIKGKHEDDQIIEILINSIIADIDYKEGEKTSKLLKKVLQLLGRIVATSPGTAKTWKAYAKLLISNNEPVDKIVNCLSKSHQCCMRQISWEKDSSKTLEILENAKDLSDYYLDIFEKCDDLDKRKLFLSSFRLSLRSLLSIAEKNAHYWNTSENSSAIEKLFNSLKQQHETICAKLDLKSEI